MTRPGGTTPTVIPDVEARPVRALLVAGAVGVALLLYGVFEPGQVLSDVAARAVWIALTAACTVPFVLGPLWARLRVTDGVLTKRVLRTRRVDLTDLVTIRTFRDRPWQSNPPGVIRFEDARGGAVDVPLVSGPWVPTEPLWRSLAVAIEASGLPMSGIVGAQVEIYLQRSLRVDDANRAALERRRAELRHGRTTPHTTRGGGLDTPRLLALGGVLVAASVLGAAVGGAFPPEAAGTVQVAAAVVLLALVALLFLRRREHLRLTADATLRSRAGEVQLGQLSSVDLVPDHAFLSTTVGGRIPLGRRTPHLRLQDRAGGDIDVDLGGRWREPVPLLRAILAAADERGVPLTEHARYELEFRCGLTGRTRWPADDTPGTTGA